MLNLSGDSSDLTDEEKTELGSSDTFTINKDTLTQYLVTMIKTQHPSRYVTIQIGDPVEDLLNLAYQLLGSEFHKISMNDARCCTLTDQEGGFIIQC